MKKSNISKTQAEAAVAECGSVKAAAEKLGITRKTLWRIRKSETKTSELPPETKLGIEADAEEFVQSGLHAKVSRLEAENVRLKERQIDPNMSIIGPDQTITSPEDAWKAAEAENAQKIVRAAAKHKFTAHYKENLPIGICFPSDMHISTGAPMNLKKCRLDAEIIRDTPNMYVMLGGDSVDNHIKHFSAVLAQRDQPGDQWKLFNYYLEIIRDSILTAICGNHCNWTNQYAGIDMVGWLSANNKIHYAPHEARVEITVGTVTYNIAVRHQYRFNSNFNLLHVVKRWYDMGTSPFDVGVVAHHHEAALETFPRHGCERIGIRPGSYQYMTGYSDQYGFNPATPTTPAVILYPFDRSIIGFNDVQKAAKFLKSELRG